MTKEDQEIKAIIDDYKKSGQEITRQEAVEMFHIMNGEIIEPMAGDGYKPTEN